jgi:hypothetical protein
MSEAGGPQTRLNFDTSVLYWRGPSPFFFAPIPQEHVTTLARLARAVTYGWGMIPVEASIGGARFATSLFPKDGGYLLPLKDAVRRKTGVTAGDRIAVELIVQAGERAR